MAVALAMGFANNGLLAVAFLLASVYFPLYGYHVLWRWSSYRLIIRVGPIAFRPFCVTAVISNRPSGCSVDGGYFPFFGSLYAYWRVRDAYVGPVSVIKDRHAILVDDGMPFFTWFVERPVGAWPKRHIFTYDPINNIQVAPSKVVGITKK